MNLTLRRHDLSLSIVKLDPQVLVETPVSSFWALLKTPDEMTLICPTASVPSVFLKAEPGWTAFEVLGPLDFSLTGILAGLSGCLAKAGISLFALSTFNTDWILVREMDATPAAEALKAGGYVIVAP